jgi:lysine 6-dehydrogenase
MQVLCLGGAGRICREAALDLVQFSSFDRITIADFDEQAGRDVAEWLGDPRVDFVSIDINDEAAAVEVMSPYDIVMDGTTISLNDVSTRCIANAGCHGINLNGFGEEYKYDETFRRHGTVHVPGFGMTPGTTNMMAVHAAEQLETVETIRVSHGAFRPIAFSRSIAETTTYEYDPDLPGRMVYEDGEFKQVPPFARPREIPLSEPYGTHTQYIIPHSETITLAQYLEGRGVRLIEVRGTWPPANMQLIRALNDWGILQNPHVSLDGRDVGVLDAIAEYLINSEAGTTTELYGYALHVEVTGTKDGRAVTHTLTHTHPPSDGSVPDWAGLRSYTRNVGIPMAIGVDLIAGGRIRDITGVAIPERVFRPVDVFNELERRNIMIHHDVS